MLIVEDGTGLPDAESYVSEADATAYWTDRNVTDWTGATVQLREAALRISADYLNLAYRWPGQHVSVTQRLAWPRAGVPSGAGYFPSNAVPAQIIDAQLVLAVEAISNNLLLRVTAEQQRQITEETKSLKGITKTLKFATAEVDSLSRLRRYPVVDQILAGIAVGGTSGAFGVARLIKA